MAYEPKTWVCGEKIKAEDLNNIEEGVQEALNGGRLIATLNQNNVLDKTWQQIYDAFPNVAIEMGQMSLESVGAISGDPTNNSYGFWTANYNNSFSATTPDDYPVLENE